MKTIKEYKETIYEIKKSKFLAYAFCVNDEKEVNKYIEDTRKEHRNATHVTFAYILHSPQIEKCSDDGEPSGTAGKPMLDVLKKNELTNILVIVIRYFGGIKLGAGGLCRAYSTSVKMVLDLLEFVTIQKCDVFEVEISIDQKYLIENDDNYKIIETDYSNISEKIIRYKIVLVTSINNEELLNKKCRKVEYLESKYM